MKFLLVALFLPPFGFVTLAAMALLLPASRARLRQTLLIISVIGLTILAMPVFADRLLEGLERQIPSIVPGSPNTTTPEAIPEAIIVLGAEIRRTTQTPKAVIGRLSLERVQTAARLHRRTGLPVLISGGALQKDLPSIAAVMADSMEEDFRIPVRWREGRSRDTWENALFSAEILKKEGIRTVYVVTHAWHMRRAIQAFRQTGLTVIPAPTPPDERDGAIAEDFLPRASTWTVSFFALHEWIGYVWYALR